MKYTFFDIECANCIEGQAKICSFGYVITDEQFNLLEKEDLIVNPKAIMKIKTLSRMDNAEKKRENKRENRNFKRYKKRFDKFGS